MSTAVAPEAAGSPDAAASEGGGAVPPAGGGPASGAGFRAVLRAHRQLVAWVVFVVALLVYVAFLGIPYSTDDILLWITAALGRGGVRRAGGLGGDRRAHRASRVPM